ncbi:MAG: insulinase family protein [Alphaproteobacteria bacterium]|nr:insulinase family protein [Alphaproteobacteria bacterium]
MRLRPMRSACAILALCLTAAAGSAQAAIFNAETFVLENGMEVVVIPNHRSPVVSHQVWYRVGSADEAPGKTGLAHLLEHLMFKGTDKVPAGAYSRLVARNGGRDNAFTAFDYTGYYVNVAKDRLELAMTLEADRMVNLRLAEKDVLTERDVVLEERRSRTDNNPSALLNEQVRAALYLNHPYHNPVIGWASEVGSLSRADAEAFYHRWYAPNNAILVVAGDITAAELKPLAEKHYGAIPARTLPERLRNAEPPQVAARRVELRDARVRQPSWSRSYHAPSYNRDPDGLAYALQVLSEVVGGGATSQIYRSLVVDKELASSAGAWYDPTAIDTSTFGVYVSPRPGVEIAEVERAMEAEVAAILEKGVAPEEIERAKRRLQASAVYARDSLYTGANVLGTGVTTGQSVADIEAWPERIAAVTAGQVAQAARKVLDEKASVTGVLLPDGDKEGRS